MGLGNTPSSCALSIAEARWKRFAIGNRASYVPVMLDASKYKIVGRRTRSGTPEECLRRAWQLQQQAERLSPYPRARGFIFKARTREEYEAWRRGQSNPRLW
jgi:hypothetical protein